jgi:hypothetical protein
MTAFFDNAKAIVARFDTQWAAVHAGFPVVHDNEHYEPAEGVEPSGQLTLTDIVRGETRPLLGATVPVGPVARHC